MKNKFNPVIGILVFVAEISFSPMRVVSMFFVSLGIRNYSYLLKFKTQHDGIGNLGCSQHGSIKNAIPKLCHNDRITRQKLLDSANTIGLCCIVRSDSL